VNIEVEHVVFGLHDVALRLHNMRRYSGKVLDERLTTVIHLYGGKIRRLDTFISDVAMINSYFVDERSE
jgi:ketosteroid isomerase-like protein